MVYFQDSKATSKKKALKKAKFFFQLQLLKLH